ncbi:MAG TPA: ROK family transcriptional regulator [Anaerolineaceae bacterium]|nr:ROK family transcriptional regulator [Anaerolineaceae bacterium]
MKKATREQTRLHNTRIILRIIYESGPVSRADLARLTKLTPPTVSDLVEDLLSERLISEVGFGVSGGGKPPTLLTVVDDARLVIGLDLSENIWRGAVIDLRGKIIRSEALQFSNAGQPAVDQVIALIDRLLSEIPPEAFLGIGIGCPGIIHEPEGVIGRVVKYRWEELPLRKILQDHYHVPVMIANDSHVAALAEYYFGQAKAESAVEQNPKAHSLVLLKVSDGISAGIILSGKIYYGDGFGAGEIGHICVEPNGARCRCGHMGCLETVASERAVLQMARKTFRSSAELDDAQVMQKVQTDLVSGTGETQPIVNRAGEFLGLAAANIIGLLNVHQIVLAGSLSALGDALLQPMIRVTGENALDAMTQQTQISISKLGNDIVQLGAAALVQQDILGIF